MSTNQQAFFVGSRVTVSASFTLDDVNKDPSTVRAEVTAPSGQTTVVTYPSENLSKVKTGVFQLSVDCTQVGTWSVAWASTGVVQAVDVVRFSVKSKGGVS